ncbi:HD-GYP domain-containing protein [Desulfovibrio oxyclinae]|uniref:HD-GYP domain-containing protein n=1 Tax=Desulfovibrio oxyclinae TaxID=63560 RepID=UPI00035C4559|nr:HD domain-containing phosphohydrolase [Desulfovibrio oxyclinae]
MMPRVLIVDDEKNLLSALRRHMRAVDYEIITEENPGKALDILRRENPAVLVTDLKMPGMDGIELLRRAQELQPDCIRILMTGYADLAAAVDAVNHGGIFRFLAKPFQTEDLQHAIDQAMRYRSFLESDRELQILKRTQSAMEGMIHAFVDLVETRDPYTCGHQNRVARLSVAIGRKAGLDDDRLHGLRLAALVHDIGKIGVPFSILNKPGVLSEAEMAIIREHPETGWGTLRHVDFPWPIAEVVLQHHERLDGSGYPHGLQGDAICTEARIIAVADMVDAMASHRPYRPALGVGAALKELRAKRQTQYDARFADICVELFDDGYRLIQDTAAAPQTG